MNRLIYAEIINRQISWLCHFTPRANLEKIKKEGLKLRKTGEMQVTDRSRADQNNFICLSISEPNRWMLEHKISKGHDLVLLLIDPNVLYKKKCLFYTHNAATKCFRLLPFDELSSPAAFKAMFAPVVNVQTAKNGLKTYQRKNNEASFIPTSKQAEVQVMESIEPQHILYIFEKNLPLNYHEIYHEYSLYIARKRKINNIKEKVSQNSFNERLFSNDDNETSNQLENRRKDILKNAASLNSRRQNNGSRRGFREIVRTDLNAKQRETNTTNAPEHLFSNFDKIFDEQKEKNSTNKLGSNVEVRITEITQEIEKLLTAPKNIIKTGGKLFSEREILKKNKIQHKYQPKTKMDQRKTTSSSSDGMIALVIILFFIYLIFS